MSLGSKEYICRRGIGDRDMCLRIMDETRASLEQLYKDGVIQGSVRQVFYSIEGLEKEDIEPSLVLAVNHGIFPVLWLNMTFEWNDANISVVNNFSEQFHFTEISHFISNY